MDKLYNVGIYARLSVDDGRNSRKKNVLDGDSASIENQRAILSEYVMLRGWNEARFYYDDGYSGGNFERPGFQQMVRDAQDGLINLILVKDLSRLGRDYIGVGKYTDEVFPALGCRFIALMDDIDTDGENDLMPFRSLLNDYHLKDLSRKIKSVLRAKAQSGQYLAHFAPFGYRKDPADHHKLIADEYAAGIVRRIFELRLQKHGYAKIASFLNGEGVLAPRAYCFHSQGKENPYKSTVLWHGTAVKNLLKNEIYLGHLIQHTTGTLSYKNKKQIDQPEWNWIRIDNAHEPIIDQATWDAAQAVDLKKYDPAQRKTPEPSLFSGLLVCADCGGKLMHNTAKQKRKNGAVVRYSSYRCSTYYHTGRSVCSTHSIYEISLKQIVLDAIKGHARRIECDERNVIAELRRHSSQGNEKDRLGFQKKLKRTGGRLDELDQMDAKRYEDKVAGLITQETFTRIIADAESERLELKSEQLRLTDALAEMEQRRLDIESWIATIRKHISLMEVDSETLQELVDKIEIGERKIIDGVKHQQIKIHYKYVGEIG